MPTIYDPATGQSTYIDSKGRKVFTAVHAPYVTDPSDPFGFEEADREKAARAEAARQTDTKEVK